MAKSASRSLSFSSLPDDIVLNCLARISKSEYPSLCTVSKGFHSLLSSPEIYAARSQIGSTEPCLYVCLQLHQTKVTWFTLTNGEFRLEPVKLSPSYSCPGLNASHVAVGSEIYLMGVSKEGKRSRLVRVLDCLTHTWRRAPNMIVARKHSKSCFLDGNIYVVGGCRETANWGEVFDLKTQTWKPLPSPSDTIFHTKHRLVGFGARVYVITQDHKYAYDPKQGTWEQGDFLELGFLEKTYTLTLSKMHMLRNKRKTTVFVEDPLQPCGPWCIIGNVMFITDRCKYWYYDARRHKWLPVQGLCSIYDKQDHGCPTLQLLNYGGKLLILWPETIRDVVDGYAVSTHHRRIWCAVIRLEERTQHPYGPMIWGQVERMNVVLPQVHMSYKLLTCLSVSF